MMTRVDRVKSVILNNWQLKLLATGLAVLAFYGIRGATSFEVPYDIPLKVEVGQGIAILDQPKTVRVLFRGSQDDLRRLSQKEIAAVVRPKATDPTGSERITLGSGDIEGAPGVRVMQIDPRVVVLSFDRESEKVIPVAKPQTIGVPLIGKVELDYTPREVTIRGSNLRLQNTKEVSTEPVDVDGRVESFTKRVKVLLSDAGVSKVTPPEVTVTVNIVTRSVVREWTNVVVKGTVPSGFAGVLKFEPAVVKVMMKGRPEEVGSIPTNAVLAFVDCSGLSAGTVTNLPVKIHLQSILDMDAVAEPSVVKLTVNGAGG